jgi:Skp family chaperone for outer membrane proteins
VTSILLPFLRTAATVVFLATMTLQPTAAEAQSQLPIVLGVVDFDFIMNESKAAKNVKSQFEQQVKAFEAEYEKQRKSFKEAEQKLASQQASLSEAEFRKKVGELDAQGDQIEKALTQRKRGLDAGLNQAVVEIRKALLETVRDIATKRAMTLVLNKSEIILVADAYDITDEAMKQLDVKLPAVKLKVGN